MFACHEGNPPLCGQGFLTLGTYTFAGTSRTSLSQEIAQGRWADEHLEDGSRLGCKHPTTYYPPHQKTSSASVGYPE